MPPTTNAGTSPSTCGPAQPEARRHEAGGDADHAARSAAPVGQERAGHAHHRRKAADRRRRQVGDAEGAQGPVGLQMPAEHRSMVAPSARTTTARNATSIARVGEAAARADQSTDERPCHRLSGRVRRWTRSPWSSQSVRCSDPARARTPLPRPDQQGQVQCPGPAIWISHTSVPNAAVAASSYPLRRPRTPRRAGGPARRARGRRSPGARPTRRSGRPRPGTAGSA